MSDAVSSGAGEDAGSTNWEIAGSRNRVYLLLSTLLTEEVTPELLAILKSEMMAEAFGELDSDIACYLNDQEPQKLLKDLAEEYAALFIVPGGISPHESVRLHGMLNQKPAWEAEEFYRRCGLVMRDECRLMPDHLGLELEFMGYLAGREAEAHAKQDEEEAAQLIGLQGNFFQNHIDNWAFSFLADLQRYAFHPFYKGLGSLTVNYLKTEKEYLGTPKNGKENTLP